MKSLQSKSLAWVGALLLLVALMMLGGCVDTRYTIRQVDQHHGGRINTVETSGERVISLGPLWERREYLGINYWNCSQEGEKLTCSRVCDDTWSRICSPGLRSAFGEVTKPDAGVVLARFVSRTGEQSGAAYAKEESEEPSSTVLVDEESVEEGADEEILEEVER